MASETRAKLMDMISGMSDDEVQVLLEKMENLGAKSNKRQSSRFPYTISVDFTTLSATCNAKLRDISIGGLFLDVDPSQSAFSVGKELVLRIPYPNKDKLVKIRGRIVRTTEDGVGVEFEKSLDQQAPEKDQ
jgi:hypothetical protein